MFNSQKQRGKKLYDRFFSPEYSYGVKPGPEEGNLESTEALDDTVYKSTNRMEVKSINNISNVSMMREYNCHPDNTKEINHDSDELSPFD